MMKLVRTHHCERTHKQIKQSNLRQALGTVIGFHGYLNNLESVLKRTELYNLCPEIIALHNQLKEYEKTIRYELEHIK